jgi:hypothetical protein
MKALKLNKSQSNEVEGLYGGAMLQPLPFEDYFFLPLDVLNDTSFNAVLQVLENLPIVEIDETKL